MNPANIPAFEAFTLSVNEIDREWFVEDEKKVFAPYRINTSGVYHALRGAGFTDPEIFKRVIHTLRQCLADEVIE